MLIPVKYLSEVLGINPMGVLHVGAHKAEESIAYETYGWSKKQRTIWIEAQENLAQELRYTLNHSMNKVICAVVWDREGVLLPFHVTNNGESSSVYEMEKHLSKHPKVREVKTVMLRTKTLLSLLTNEDKFEFINLDIQGAELRALVGLGEHLSKVKWIYCEVNKIPLYKGIPLIDELDDFLNKQGFQRYMTRWVPFKGWGDALYISNAELAQNNYPGTIHLQSHKLRMNISDLAVRIKRLINKV